MISLSQQQLGLNPSLEFRYGTIYDQSLPAAAGAGSIPGVQVWYMINLSQQLEARYLEQLDPSLEFRYGI